MTAAMYSSLYIYLILSRLPHAILAHHCHFQDFVSMMKQELSAQTGFSMVNILCYMFSKCIAIGTVSHLWPQPEFLSS